MNVSGIPQNWRFLYYMKRDFKIFGKYWPYDGLLGPKLAANNKITIK
jgi:hypothetical protein